MALMIVVSIAAPLCLIVIVLGCLDCLFKKKRFENIGTHRSPHAQHNQAFAVDISDVPQGTEHVTIEPLPDILAKVTTAPVLRPRITCSERGKQEATLSLVSVQRSFPRDHVTYINEIGSGWFGQAIESEAVQIVGGSATTRVVVKMLKDDASKVEQKQFMEEVTAFRCLEHANLLGLLGQCTEAAPYLVILEFAPHGDLKAYLQENKHKADALIKNNRLVSFARDVSTGLACLHRHDYVHNDLAARNCLVMGDYTVKIGDYGISDHVYKDEYLNTGTEMLPIRWMAPETLIQTEGKWTFQQCDKVSDMWSFGIILWEICSLGERPYNMLTDEAVLQGVVLDRVVLPSETEAKFPFKDRLCGLMSQCWVDPAQRLDIDHAARQLEQLARASMDTMEVISDFDHKWGNLAPNQGRTSSTDTDLGSRTALAGSFATDSSSPSSSKPSILNDSLQADVVIDVGGGEDLGEFTGAEHGELTPTKPLTPPPEVSGSSMVSLGEDTSLDKAVTTLQAEFTVENEVTKPSTPDSRQTPSKISTPQAVSTSTPVSDSQNSSSFFTPVNSPGSAYVTANETLVTIGNQNETGKLNSLGADFSLDSKDISFSELSNDTLQDDSKAGLSQNAEANVTNNNTMTKPQVSEPVEDEDFSEFVRTSPVSPSADFTEFESAETAGKHSAESGKADNEKQEPALTSAQPVNTEDTAEASADDKVSESVPPQTQEVLPQASEIPDVEKDIFDDFVTSSPAVDKDSTNPVTSGPSLGTEGQSQLGKDVMTSSTDSSWSLLQMPVEDNGEDNAQTSPKSAIDTQTSTNTEVTATDTKESIDSQDQGEKADDESGIESLPQSSIDAAFSSLPSEPSLPSSELLGSAPGAPPTHSEPTIALAELREGPVDQTDVSQPLPANVPSISEVLEESRNDLLSAANFSSDPFSSVEFQELKPSLEPAEAAGVADDIQAEDGSTAVDQEKVGNPSKNESHSAESGIASHEIAESSGSIDQDLEWSSLNMTDSSVPNASSDSAELLRGDDFKNSSQSSALKSSLYRCSHIPLTADITVSESEEADGMDDAYEDDNDECHGSPTHYTSPTDSDTESGSSTSGSGREYVCVGHYDTGQPPPPSSDTSQHSSIPSQSFIDTSSSSSPSSSSYIDFDEHALQVASEIYLSRGLSSPRQFEIPPLETIPEHQPMPSIQEETNQTPSDTSSMEVRYEDLFGSDGYEWDDFFGDPLVGREMASSQSQDQRHPSMHNHRQSSPQHRSSQQHSPLRELDLSDWSLEIDSDSVASSHSLVSRISEEVGPNTSTHSDQTYLPHHDTSTEPTKNVHCLSDSELVVPGKSLRSSYGASKQTLVSSLLSSLPTAGKVISPDRADFYSLTDQDQIETDSSSSEGPTSPALVTVRASDSLSSSSTHSSSPSPSVAASTPLPSSPSPPPESDLSGVHCDIDLPVTFDPSMGSGLHLINETTEIQSDHPEESFVHVDNLLGVDTDQKEAATQEGPAEDNLLGDLQTNVQQTSQQASDPFGDLLGLDITASTGVSFSEPGQKMEEVGQAKDEERQVTGEEGSQPQAAEASLIEF